MSEKIKKEIEELLYKIKGVLSQQFSYNKKCYFHRDNTWNNRWTDGSNTNIWYSSGTRWNQQNPYNSAGFTGYYGISSRISDTVDASPYNCGTGFSGISGISENINKFYEDNSVFSEIVEFKSNVYEKYFNVAINQYEARFSFTFTQEHMWNESSSWIMHSFDFSNFIPNIMKIVRSILLNNSYSSYQIFHTNLVELEKKLLSLC